MFSRSLQMIVRRHRALARRGGVAASMSSAAGAGGRQQSFYGFTAPHVASWHKTTGTTMMVIMWLWVFYRAKNDGLSVLGLEHPWDSHGHGGGHGGHATHPDSVNYEKEAVGQRPSVAEE